jgi:hypothetical protein
LNVRAIAQGFSHQLIEIFILKLFEPCIIDFGKSGRVAGLFALYCELIGERHRRQCFASESIALDGRLDATAYEQQANH